MQNLNKYLPFFFAEYNHAWPETIKRIEDSNFKKELINQLSQYRDECTYFWGWVFNSKKFNEKVENFKKELENQQNPEYLEFQEKIFKNKRISEYPYLHCINLDAYPEHKLLIEHGEEIDVSPLLQSFFDHEQLNNYYDVLNELLPGLRIIRTELINFFSKVQVENEIITLHEHEFEKLRLYIFNYLQQYNLHFFNTIPLDEFNYSQSQLITKVLLKHIYHVENITYHDIDKSFQKYRSALKKELLKEYQDLNLWKKSPVSKKLPTQFKKSFQSIVDMFQNLADTHAFIQGTGYSTQNEHSHLALLDIVNYYRYSNQIKELKTIFNCIIRSLLPIYQEYLWLSYQQNHPLLTTFRLVLPILFITGFIVSGLYLLQAFFYPEIVILILIIPITYIGLILLSQLFELKNVAYQKFQECIYGGFYYTPFFQINTRVKNFFGLHANDIHQFYISKLEQDQKNIQKLSQTQQEKGLDTHDLNLLIDLQKQQKNMLAEWADIHHNVDISKEQALEIVLQRIHLEADFQNQEYKKLIQKVRNEIDTISQNLEQHLLQANIPFLSTQSIFHPQIINKSKILLNLHALELELHERPQVLESPSYAIHK